MDQREATPSELHAPLVRAKITTADEKEATIQWILGKGIDPAATPKHTLTANPNDTEACRTLAGAPLGLTQHAEAIPCHGRALEPASRDTINPRNRASAISAIVTPKAAYADIGKALKAAPRYIAASYIGSHVVDTLVSGRSR